MNRKKLIFLVTLIVGIMFSAQSASASCSIWRHDFNVSKVRVNDSLSGDKVPVIAIGWSSDHTDDMTIYVELQGAEWNYGTSGTIQQGVKYHKVGKSTLELSIDVGTGPDEINFNHGKNIYLPINCTVKDAGEIKVRIDGTGTTVSNANLLIAQAIDGSLTVHGNKAELNNSGNLKKITITDSSTQKYAANKRFTLELNGGFRFDGGGEVIGTGKFKDAVQFEVDKNKPSKAYIKITKETGAEKGEIIMDGLSVSRKSTSKFAVLLLETQFEASVVPLDSTISVASYKADATTTETTTKATTQTTKETTTEATTQAKADTIVIPINSNSYTINGELYTMDTPAYIYAGNTMLPLRAFANAMGIADNSIDYNSQTKTVTLYKTADNFVTITVGEPSISLTSGGLNAKMDISAPAEITNGRLFLPLRAMANALGIPDNSIQYSPSAKTVTITK